MSKQSTSGLKALTLAALMGGTMFTQPVRADDDTSERLARLEAMLMKVMERLEKHESILSTQEVEVVAAAQRAVSEQVATAVAEATPQKARKAKDGFMVGDTNIKIGGYVKADLILSRFSDGALPSGNVGRDFYIPALVPVRPDGEMMDDWVTDFSARETRLGFKTETPAGDDKITTYLEMDFLVTPGGDERISNSYEPRMRHAWVQYKGFRIGQDWSTFMDLGAFPDNLDFVGPAEGLVFERQPLIRYSTGGFDFALEQPETAFTSEAGGRIISGSDPLPDFVARYTHKGEWGHLRIAGIVRELNEEEGVIPGVVEDTEVGYGLTLSGKIKVGDKDDFRFQVTGGEGLGRYVGLNVVNGAAIGTDGRLQTIATYNGYASYRHFWRDDLRSNFTFGYFKADNPVELTGGGVTDESLSLHANLIYSPFKKFDVGIEYLYARRELENGLSGNLNRIQFSTKYAF